MFYVWGKERELRLRITVNVRGVNSADRRDVGMMLSELLCFRTCF